MLVYVIKKIFFSCHKLKRKEKTPRGIIFCICVWSPRHILSLRKTRYYSLAVVMTEKVRFLNSVCSLVYHFMDVVKLAIYLILCFSDLWVISLSFEFDQLLSRFEIDN